MIYQYADHHWQKEAHHEVQITGYPAAVVLCTDRSYIVVNTCRIPLPCLIVEETMSLEPVLYTHYLTPTVWTGLVVLTIPKSAF